MFGKGEDVVVVIEDGEFGCAVEGFFEALQNGDPSPWAGTDMVS